MEHERGQVCLALDGVPSCHAKQLLDEMRSWIWGIKMHDKVDCLGVHGASKPYKAQGFRLFADPKIHDTPETTALRIDQYARAHFDLVTVHAAAGVKALQAAVNAGGTDTKILAVIELTSNPRSLREVLDNLDNAYRAKVHGIVIPCNRLRLFSQEYADRSDWNPLLVTPGIRRADANPDSHKFPATPRAAVLAGAHLMVVGSLVTAATHQVLAARELKDEIEAARKELKEGVSG